MCVCVCLTGMYIPSCDEDGYYKKVQCDQSQRECWCVDQHGGEMMGTRIHGNPDCGKRGGGRGRRRRDGSHTVHCKKVSSLKLSLTPCVWIFLHHHD